MHMDKQSRKADFTGEQDTDVEIKDWERFAEKWGDRPDVMAKHPRPDRILYNMMKSQYWDDSEIQPTVQRIDLITEVNCGFPMLLPTRSTAQHIDMAMEVSL